MSTVGAFTWWTQTALHVASSGSAWGGMKRQQSRFRSIVTRWNAKSSCRAKRGVIPPSSTRLSRCGKQILTHLVNKQADTYRVLPTKHGCSPFLRSLQSKCRFGKSLQYQEHDKMYHAVGGRGAADSPEGVRPRPPGTTASFAMYSLQCITFFAFSSYRHSCTVNRSFTANACRTT